MISDMQDTKFNKGKSEKNHKKVFPVVENCMHPVSKDSRVSINRKMQHN